MAFWGRLRGGLERTRRSGDVVTLCAIQTPRICAPSFSSITIPTINAQRSSAMIQISSIESVIWHFSNFFRISSLIRTIFSHRIKIPKVLFASLISRSYLHACKLTHEQEACLREAYARNGASPTWDQDYLFNRDYIVSSSGGDRPPELKSNDT